MTDDQYQIFLRKLIRQIKPVSHLLGYCLMPNHFHLLVIPKTKIKDVYILQSKQPVDSMPTIELGEAMKRLQMGYTKSFNKFYGLTGSRFQQHAKAQYHDVGLRNGLKYLHENPSKAKLVSHPSEWGYSSYLEYTGSIDPKDCVCEVKLGQSLII